MFDEWIKKARMFFILSNYKVINCAQRARYGVSNRIESNRIEKYIDYCKTHYYHAPFNFTNFALGDDNAYITGADIRSK